MYDLFYRYASSLHHADPMGLAMLVDRETLEVRPGLAVEYRSTRQLTWANRQSWGPERLSQLTRTL